MRYAILGDIHGNLEALQAVLADARAQQCTHYVSLGDLVGYGPNPRECIETLRTLNCQVVLGNHDEYCTHEGELVGFNPLASDGIRWTRSQLAEEDKEWLRSLKHVRVIEAFTVVHATLDLPEKWAYVFDKLAAAASFNYQHTAVCFNGHTHVPMAFIRAGGAMNGGLYSRIKIEVGRKYFINAGSIGQPRDRNPKAAYVIFDMPSNLVELRRIPYDIASVQQKIRGAGLPEALAQRLEQGR